MVTDEEKKNTTDTFCLKTEKDNEKPTSKAEEKNNLMQNSKAREGGVCGEDQGALQFLSCHHMDKRIKEFNAYILIENRKGQRKKHQKKKKMA